MTSSWFEIREFPDGVIGIGEPGHSEDVKSYLVRGSELAMLVDTGMGIGDLRAAVEPLISTPILVVNSHSHWDHVGSNWQFDRIWIHEAEADRLPAGRTWESGRGPLGADNVSRPLPDGVDPEHFSIRPSTAERTLREGDVVDLGDRTFSVIHTPGHSPGGITLIEPATGIALVGDAVYAGALYAHMRGECDPVVYRATLAKLADLAQELRTLYPSHNAYPLDPGFLNETHQGMEEVWGGKQPDQVAGGVERYQFVRFSILLAEGWRASAR